jgi:hypothetical protein
MCPGWINEALAALPGTDDALFQRVWTEQRLLFDERRGVGDTVDYLSACLVAAVLKRSSRLLITLPDFQPHRPAFLFATAMIRHFLDSGRPVNSAMPRSRPVLYFGSTVGIRDQLRRTSVRGLGLALADVFSQADFSRGTTGSGHDRSMSRVITVYAPADPVATLKAYRPSWIAVDCGDAASLIWLQPLLEETAREGIPIIAWGQNPLSECAIDFASSCQTFTWPPSVQLFGCLPIKLEGELDTLLHTLDPIYLTPFVLQGESIGPFSTSMREVVHLLSRASRHLEGRFGSDAIAVHWKYLRSLEALAIPFDFYEAEAPRYWGLQSLGKLAAVCEHFRLACMQGYANLYRDLEEVASLLNKAKDNLENQGCPLWEALANFCIEDPASEEVRILVFTSESRKRLFLFAMLARHNITEDDLLDMRTHVASLSELRRWTHCYHCSSNANGDDNFFTPSLDAVWHPVLIGLPSPSMTPRLLYAFLHPKIDIVLYPHQCSSFMRRQEEWSFRLTGDPNRNVDALACLSRLQAPHSGPAKPKRISVEHPVEVNIETTMKTRTSFTGAIWQPEDPVNEVARLFPSDDECEGEELVLNDQPEAGTSLTIEPSEEIWCAEAVKVQFDQGWHAYFAPDDMINVVRDGGRDKRYVRSLRVGERVLLIHGQQRQSLYDLIISRVHKHPSIELHIAMIRRWQEDIRVAFEQWLTLWGDPSELRAHGARDLDGLLRRMQLRGSKLVSPLTLSFWVRGFVLCPQDPEDLRRVAEVLNMGFVRQHYRHIERAAVRLRGLHRGVSLKLNRWLQAQATTAVHTDEDDVIDTELGLTFGDVKNSLLVVRVGAVENVAGPFLRSNLGRVEKD